MAPRRRNEVRQVTLDTDLLVDEMKLNRYNGKQLAETISRFPDCEGVTNYQVSRWRSGAKRPDLPAALALQAVFGRPVWDWFRWPEKKPLK